MVECHSESVPFIVGHHEERVGSRFQRANLSVDETEVLEYSPQFRTHPECARLAVHLLEDEESAGLLGVEAGRLDHPHHRVCAAVAVDIARLKLIHGVGEAPVVEEIEAVVSLPQGEAVFLRVDSGTLRVDSG